MASRRFLNIPLILIVLFALSSGSCATAENATVADPAVVDTTASGETSSPEGGVVQTENRVQETEKYIDPSDYSFYERYQTKLSDLYTTRRNSIPDAFLIEDEPEEDEVVEKDPFQGFRVQIYSARDVLDADTTAALFRTWADTTITGYQADTYIFFKPPYYRIHVGDFHERDRAQRYARLIKRRFRSAWVVYDRVNPLKVPADSVSFSLIN